MEFLVVMEDRLALALMKTARSPTNYPNLLVGGPGYRIGRVQRLARRALIAADGPVTTATLMQWGYAGKHWSESRWRHMRRAAEKIAVRVTPKTRPLRWRLKDR